MSYIFGGLVVCVYGVSGNLSNYVIQVYLLTFKKAFSYFEQCVSSLSLTHTSLGNVLAPVKIKTQIFECPPEKYLSSEMTEHVLIIYECNFIPVTSLKKLSQAPPPVLTCD